MANPHLPQKQSSSELAKEDRVREVIVKHLVRGRRPNEIARAITDDRDRRKYWRNRIWRMVKSDPKLHTMIAETAHAELALGLVPVTKRLVERATNLGKPQEVKLVMEASQFHNPRVQHEHSGDVKVSIDIPRPVRVPNLDEQVEDAEVVDD